MATAIFNGKSLIPISGTVLELSGEDIAAHTIQGTSHFIRFESVKDAEKFLFLVATDDSCKVIDARDTCGGALHYM